MVICPLDRQGTCICSCVGRLVTAEIERLKGAPKEQRRRVVRVTIGRAVIAFARRSSGIKCVSTSDDRVGHRYGMDVVLVLVLVEVWLLLLSRIAKEERLQARTIQQKVRPRSSKHARQTPKAESHSNVAFRASCGVQRATGSIFVVRASGAWGVRQEISLP
jgi:hypothetical protein